MTPWRCAAAWALVVIIATIYSSVVAYAKGYETGRCHERERP